MDRLETYPKLYSIAPFVQVNIIVLIVSVKIYIVHSVIA